MNSTHRKEFWNAVEKGSDPLLSVLHGLTERWGLPAIIMALGDISEILSEDAVDAKYLTPNQRGLIIGACAQVNQLSDQMKAEMAFIKSNPND